MDEKIRSFKVGNDVYDIPFDKVDSFLDKTKTLNPTEILTYEVGKDKYDIPVDRVRDFVGKIPQAKAAYDYPALDTLFKEPSQYERYTQPQFSEQDTFSGVIPEPPTTEQYLNEQQGSSFGKGVKAGWENMKGGLKYLAGALGETVDKFDNENDWEFDDRMMESARRNFDNAPIS